MKKLHKMVARLTTFLMRVSAIGFLGFSLTGASKFSLDQIHASFLGESREMRLLREFVSPTVGGTKFIIPEGYLIKDSNMQDVWRELGGAGKFHASPNQDPDYEKSLLITSYLKLTTDIDDYRFYVCKVSVSRERDPDRLQYRRVVQLEVRTIADYLEFVGGVVTTVEKKEQKSYVALNQTGTFLDLDLSSQNIYEMTIRALDEQGKPINMVIADIAVSNRASGC